MNALLLPILSGILVGTSYIPFPPWALLFCLVPLWKQYLKCSSYRQVFIAGWVTQFVLTLIGFNWIAHTVREFGNIPFPLNFGALAGYCAFSSLHFPLSGLLWMFLSRQLKASRPVQLLLLPLCFSVCEFYYPMIFDWHLGYTWLWLGWPGFHLAEWIGFKGLSWLSVFLNLPFFLAWEYRKQRSKALKFAGIGLIIFTFAQFLGFWIGKTYDDTTDAVARVGVVQANIGNLEKQYAEQGLGFREHIVSEYLENSQNAVAANTSGQPIDFLIWPETAYPERIGFGRWNTNLVNRVRSFLVEKQVALVTGAYGWGGDDDQVTNSILMIDRTGQPSSEAYSKTVLLAFGEYFPGAEWFPILREWVPAVGDFVRGQGPTILHLGGLNLGPLICYEGLFDDMSRDLNNMGAQLLVNVTNDSWYGTWEQPYQHLYMTLARAIETRLPFVRSTNTGISTVILANGKILEQSPLHKEWSHLYEIPYKKTPQPTIFSGLGFYFVRFCDCLIFLLILGWTWRERSYKPRLD